MLIAILFLNGCTEKYENSIEQVDQTNVSEISDLKLDEITNTLILKISEQGELYSQEFHLYWNNVVSIGTPYDFNNDGINDYVVAFPTYGKYVVTVFNGDSMKVIYEVNEVTEFVPQYIKTEIYISQENIAFFRSNRYNKTVAADTLIDEVQIDINNQSYCFEAVYDKNTNKFIHAYDKYKNEEDYLSAQTEILKDYKFDKEITWSELLNYKDDKNAKQALISFLSN